jgi:hypothetical protein
MRNVLDIVIISGIVAAAGCYVFFALAPRAWRFRALITLGRLAARVAMLGGLSRRLDAAAVKLSVAGGCGSCGNCATDKSAADASGPGAPADSFRGAEVSVPLSAVQRRR